MAAFSCVSAPLRAFLDVKICYIRTPGISMVPTGSPGFATGASRMNIQPFASKRIRTVLEKQLSTIRRRKQKVSGLSHPPEACSHFSPAGPYRPWLTASLPLKPMRQFSFASFWVQWRRAVSASEKTREKSRIPLFSRPYAIKVAAGRRIALFSAS